MNPLLEQFLSTELDVSEVPVKAFRVELTNLQTIREFVEHWHYSNNVTGLRADHCFRLMYEGQMIGAMIYGTVGMPNAWKRYVEKEEDLIELRRLCCIDNTPKNTESYFIGKTIKWLKKNTDYTRIISYADTFRGHEGTIYKASNFTHGGMSPGGKMLEYQGRLYHDKVLRNYRYKTHKDGSRTPILDENGQKIVRQDAVKYRKALETGEAKIIKTPGKHIYLYDL